MKITVFPEISANAQHCEPWRLEKVYKFLQIYLIIFKGNTEIIHLREHKGTLNVNLGMNAKVENICAWTLEQIWMLIDSGGSVKIIKYEDRDY